MSHSPNCCYCSGTSYKANCLFPFCGCLARLHHDQRYNPLVGFVKIISDYVMPSLSGNASLIVLVTLSGGMIAMLRKTGAANAFATRVTKIINTAKKGQIVTSLSAFIFCYTELA